MLNARSPTCGAISTAVLEAAVRCAARLGERCRWRERCALLSRAVDAFVANGTDIATEITWQMGRPIRHSPGEVRGFEERARYMLGIAASALAPIDPGGEGRLPAPDQARAAGGRRGRRAVELSVSDGRECGVAGADRRQCRGAQALAPDAAVRRALPRGVRRAPACRAGVFQYLHLSHADTSRLMGDARDRSVCFTGSVAGGRAVVEATAARLCDRGP